jgi:hypothetical protein
MQPDTIATLYYQNFLDWQLRMAEVRPENRSAYELKERKPERRRRLR